MRRALVLWWRKTWCPHKDVLWGHLCAPGAPGCYWDEVPA